MELQFKSGVRLSTAPLSYNTPVSPPAAYSYCRS